jgi:hypothetical protein
MTHIIEQQNLYLQTTKQRIVRNLNDIDDEINSKTHDDVNMEGSGTTIREMFMKHLDNNGNALFHSMEHTNNSDVYRLLFDESNTEQVDTLLSTIKESLDTMGDWDNADSHYRYHSHKKVNIVGIQPRSEQSYFWNKHFAGFVKNSILSVIDTSHLHQPPKGRKNSNRAQPSYSDIDRGRGPNENGSDITGPTAAKTTTQQTQHNPAPSPGTQVSLDQQASSASPSREGTMSGLANVKRKLAEIEKEREQLIFSQHKIKDDVSEMKDSFTKMSGDMVNLRKDLSDLSECVGRQMKELKTVRSPREARQKGKRGSPVAPNTGRHLTRPAHASISMLQNHWIACVNLMTITIESSAQRDQLLPMTIVQCQSGRGLTCINESTRAFGWGISSPYPLTSSAGQLAKCPDQPQLLPDAWVSLS